MYAWAWFTREMGVSIGLKTPSGQIFRYTWFIDRCLNGSGVSHLGA